MNITYHWKDNFSFNSVNLEVLLAPEFDTCIYLMYRILFVNLNKCW